MGKKICERFASKHVNFVNPLMLTFAVGTPLGQFVHQTRFFVYCSTEHRGERSRPGFLWVFLHRLRYFPKNGPFAFTFVHWICDCRGSKWRHQCGKTVKNALGKMTSRPISNSSTISVIVDLLRFVQDAVCSLNYSNDNWQWQWKHLLIHAYTVRPKKIPMLPVGVRP